MSSLWAEPTRSDEEALISARHGQGAAEGGGQRHDRISGGTPPGGNGNGTGMGGASTKDIQVSAGQRMISATWGSILTSLLGRASDLRMRIGASDEWLTFCLVTPLDVVRVRLQSQNTPTSNFQQHNLPAAFSKLPPNLGVTACCREVFWVDNHAQFCVANPAVTLNNSSSAPSLAADCAAEETQRRTFTSTFDGMKKIARNDGILSLWRGLSPTLLMAIPANVIYFTGYDYLRYDRRSPINRYTNDTYAPLLAGSFARFIAASAISPIEMFRTRMQAASGSSTGLIKSTFTGLHQLTQTNGYSSLWRGLTLTMWRDVPFSAIYWWGYEAMRNSLSDARDRSRGRSLDPDGSPARRRSLSRERENHTNTFIDAFVAGATSGAVAALVTTPFDVGKTRQQVFQDSLDGHVPGNSRIASAKPTSSPATTIQSAKNISVRPEQLTMPKFLYHIYHTEGLSGLFKGWAARCLKVAPACAIMISSYEIGKKMAKTINEKREDGHEANK
jgi:solute carrier family 25, member 39/40